MTTMNDDKRRFELGNTVLAMSPTPPQPAPTQQPSGAQAQQLDAPSMSITPLSATKSLQDLDLLAKSSVLAHLNMKELSTFIDALDQLVFPAGTIVMKQGDQGEHMYFVLDGQARARRGSMDVARLGPGDHFGETTILGVPMHTTTVQAESILRLARLSRSRFLLLATNHPRVALHIVEALATTLASSLTAMTDDVGLLLRQRTLPRRTTVRVMFGGKILDVGMGSLVGTLLPREIDGALVVAAALDHKAVSLDAPITSDLSLEPITVASWEGRRIYRTSAGLLLLEAARRAYPEGRMALRARRADRQVARLTLPHTTESVVEISARLQQLMHDLVAAATPLREELWTLEEARVRMEEQGWADAASLLPFHRDKTITLVSCGKTFALGLGPVVPNARELHGVSIEPFPRLDLGAAGRSDHGQPQTTSVDLLLGFGAPLDAHVTTRTSAISIVQDQARSETSGEMTEQLGRWLETMGVTSVGCFDRSCVTGQVSELIRVSEGFHEKNIGIIADQIARRKQEATRRQSARSGERGWPTTPAGPVVAIAGPSSSGKTTFIKRLKVQLEVNGILPIHLSLDDYYVDRERTPRDAQGEWDFEALEAIDLALFDAHMKSLFARQHIRSPIYDFKSGKSLVDQGAELSLDDPRSVLLVEGLHALNPTILGSCSPHREREDTFRLFVHPATALPFDRLTTVLPEDLRLIRRIVRDRHQRGYSASQSIARWPSVRRGEERHVFTCIGEADFIFDTSLVYELAVLRVYAERYLLEIPERDATYLTAYRLRQLIDRFVPIHPDHVPPTSILREFIGGSGFDL